METGGNIFTHLEKGGAFVGEDVNDYYFDRASARYTILRGKRVLEFALWGNPPDNEYPSVHPCLVDLDDCVLYTTRSFDGERFEQYRHFPPGEVVTSDSAVYYMNYDFNKGKYVFGYPRMTAQQAKDYVFLMEYEYEYYAFKEKGELPDLSKGQATGVKYSPTTYEYIGLAGIGESALYPDTDLRWHTVHEKCNKAMYSIILKLIPEALQIANQQL